VRDDQWGNLSQRRVAALLESIPKSTKLNEIRGSPWRVNCFNKERSMYRVGFSAGLLAIAFCLSAATLQQLSLDQIGESATAIVRARIVSTATGFSGATIYTHYKIQVSETLKGQPPVEFVLPGGVSGHYRQSFPGVPALAPGAEYVLFLWTSPTTGLTYPVGLTQGIFDISTRKDGSAVLSRRPIGELMLDASGRPVTDRPPRTGLSTLRSRIAATRSPNNDGSAANGAAK